MHFIAETEILKSAILFWENLASSGLNRSRQLLPADGGAPSKRAEGHGHFFIAEDCEAEVAPYIRKISILRDVATLCASSHLSR